MVCLSICESFDFQNSLHFTITINLLLLLVCPIFLGPRENLDWGIRYKVALGTAKGLLYLHEGCQRRIIHKDIKASNILLAEDFEPQVPFFISLQISEKSCIVNG